MDQSSQKHDSVSSIIMFVFYIFFVERGITSIPLKKILRLIQPFNKNETAVRMGLSRAVQNGNLKNIRMGAEVNYELTDSGVQMMEERRRIVDSFYEDVDAQVSGWSGFWSTVMINDATFNNSDLLALVSDILVGNKFGMVSKNLWICPYSGFSAFAKVMSTDKSQSGVMVFESRPLLNNKALANTVWRTEDLGAKYAEFLAEMVAEAQGLKGKPVDDSLPFLHRFENHLIEIIKDDPQLPLETLPDDWQGIEAARAFKEIREDLLPSVREHIDQILAE